MANSYFKDMAIKINPLIYNELGITLNFYNFDNFYDSLNYMDNNDIENLFDISHDALFWFNYCSELYNLLSILESEKRALKLKYEGIEASIKSKIKKSQNIDFDTVTILKKFNIDNLNKLKDLKEMETINYNDLRKFNKILYGKVKFFEAIHFKSKNLLTKAMYELHFGFNY